MVSAKIVHQIEDHWEQVRSRFLRLVHNSGQDLPCLVHMSESDATDACRRVLANLGNWLASSSESGLAAAYERLGAERCRNAVPLSEAIRAMQFMKDATISFIQDESNIENTVDLYAEEEFENQLGRFFDLIVFHLTRGYEHAMAAKAQPAAAGLVRV
jgi:hypothetical protein